MEIPAVFLWRSRVAGSAPTPPRPSNAPATPGSAGRRRWHPRGSGARLLRRAPFFPWKDPPHAGDTLLRPGSAPRRWLGTILYLERHDERERGERAPDVGHGG